MKLSLTSIVTGCDYMVHPECKKLVPDNCPHQSTSGKTSTRPRQATARDDLDTPSLVQHTLQPRRILSPSICKFCQQLIVHPKGKSPYGVTLSLLVCPHGVSSSMRVAPYGLLPLLTILSDEVWQLWLGIPQTLHAVCVIFALQLARVVRCMFLCHS